MFAVLGLQAQRTYRVFLQLSEGRTSRRGKKTVTKKYQTHVVLQIGLSFINTGIPPDPLSHVESGAQEGFVTQRGEAHQECGISPSRNKPKYLNWSLET